MSRERHLLVDGHNVIARWFGPRALRADGDGARARLIRAVQTLHDAEDWRVTLVFDGRGAELVTEHPSGEETLTCLFTPAALTADSVIEHLVGRAPQPAECTVVTADRAERTTVEALGAVGLSPEELQAWIARAEARQSRRLTVRNELEARTWEAGRASKRPE